MSGRRVCFADAAGPIARSLIRKFTERGDSVYLVGQTEKHLSSTFKELPSIVANGNSFDSIISKATESLGGTPDVLIVNAGCGKYSLLSPSQKEEEGESLSLPSESVSNDDLKEFRENVSFSHRLIDGWLSNVWVPDPEEEGEEGGEKEESGHPCHIIVLGSLPGFSRHSSAGAGYGVEMNQFYEGVRETLKDSNVNMTLIEIAGDHLSKTGRVVMYDTKQEVPYNTGLEPEVTDAVISLLDIPDTDVAKIVWPNYGIKLSGMLGGRFSELFLQEFKARNLPMSNKIFIEKPTLPAPVEEQKEEEEVVQEEEKTIFNLVLAEVRDYDKNKLKVIKAIRAIKPTETLLNCKEYLNQMPVVLMQDVPKEQAEETREIFEAAGGILKLE